MRSEEIMETFWDNLQTVWGFVSGHLILWNMLFAIIIVFFERKEPMIFSGLILVSVEK